VPVARVVHDVEGRPDLHDLHHAEPGQLTFTRFVGDKAEDRAVISGVAMSQVGRKLFRSDLDLALEAALAAISDAGLRVEDIDGIAAYPGEGLGPPGYAGPRTDDVADALGLSLAWHRAGAEGAAQLQPVMDAVLAVAAGLCSHALVYRASTESTVGARLRDGSLTMPAAVPAAGFLEWLLPFDSITAAHWLAPYATAHMHRFGTTRAQLGAVAVNARANAAITPGATFTEPLTLEDHLSARLVSSPFGLFDCDVLVDGAVAVIVSRADATADLRQPPVRFEALGAGLGFRPSWDQWPDLTTMGAVGAGHDVGAPTAAGRRRRRPALRRLHVPHHLVVGGPGLAAHGDGGPFVEAPGTVTATAPPAQHRGRPAQLRSPARLGPAPRGRGQLRGEAEPARSRAPRSRS
jgi:acetyl-CoA acetyltransferase